MREDYLELAYLKRVLEEIIKITIFDMTDERTFKTKGNRDEQRRNKEEALQFLRSKSFEIICDAIDKPACRIRTKCLK